jgi:mono/diheme cytochrome c family protein
MRTTTFMGLGGGILVLGLALAAPVSAADGKEVFLAQKCNTCHTVSTAGIEATTKSEKMKGPDLVGVVQAHDPAWIADFVQKKVDKDGKKHSKEYKGTAEELTAIIDWLKTQTKS